jgi:XisH protein
MSAKDIFHDKVRHALEKDGWTITDDPYRLKWELTTLYVDLAAERAIAAEKDNQKIAVEVKSFIGKSETADLEQAIGQYFLYRWIMDIQDPARILFLAVPETIYRQLFEGVKGEILLSDGRLKVVGYSTENEEIIGWKI